MSNQNLILIEHLCTHFEVEQSFFKSLENIGIIQITAVNEAHFVPEENLTEIEKMLRLHQDLEVNPEGIDVIFNLLKKIEDLQRELIIAKNKLNIYE